MSSEVVPSGICFVVMPFGVKPLNDGTGRSFDFDKVYRVLIQRAVRAAGLNPLRADEQLGAQIIHLDMFKALRDNPVVLADLSTGNANVFYELGIRHVMSSKGTVLMCRRGTDLPFDIKLSRVVFYNFDGQSLDWEEAERVIIELKAALEEAQRGQPDSPVHALLEGVLSGENRLGASGIRVTVSHGDGERRFSEYQQLVADHWEQLSTNLSSLREQFGRCPFGSRALGYYVLNKQPMPAEAKAVASDLYDVEQYDLANRIYEGLEKAACLEIQELLRFGSSLSEANSSDAGARRGLEYMQKALQAISLRLDAADATAKDYESAFHCYCNVAGLCFWLWKLNQSAETLQSAIDAMQKALSYSGKAMASNEDFALGRLAQAHLKLLLMLRARDRSPNRSDSEGHGSAILNIQATPQTDQRSRSYLHWYQAITLADMGNEQDAYDLTIRRVKEDARIMNSPDCSEIGRRQYTQLRRFIEQNSSMLRNPTFVGRISQALHTR